MAAQSKLRRATPQAARAICWRRSVSLLSLATPAAKTTAESATHTLWPCSKPRPAHPEEVETTARSIAMASSTFTLVPAETPISAARSTNFFCLAPSFGLGLSDHQLQATRPGRIQLVSERRDGGFTSVTRVDSTIGARERPRIITRQGISHGRTDEGWAEPWPLRSAGSGRAIEYTPFVGLLPSRIPQKFVPRPASVINPQCWLS